MMKPLYPVLVLLILIGTALLFPWGTLSAQSPTVTPLPSVTPSPTRPLDIATGAPATATLVVTNTAASPPNAPAPSATSPLLVVTPSAAPTLVVTSVPVEAGTTPPLSIKFPQGWKGAFGRVPVRTALEERRLNIAIYRGPVPGGIGTIVVMWGFPSIAPPIAAGTETTVTPGSVPVDLVSQMLWADGLRLLQGTLVDITCNVGTSGQRPLKVGGVDGVGTFFNVSGCQDEPETAGWFVGVSPYGRNLLFYAYIEPITAYNEARNTLQGILDGVVFTSPPTATPAPSATSAP
ncbi:MAG: hypothetical protein IAE83_06010 [Anaerolinea sp.]|nr:hypothetical protein [Anaerolinea sp.]